MMATSSSSTVITCINSTLNVVDSLLWTFGEVYYIFRKVRYRLGNLRTFMLLAGKFGNCVHLGSLLIRIEDVVQQISQKIQRNSVDLEDFNAKEERLNRAKGIASDFQRDFESLKEGVHEWYIATSDNTQRSNFLTADEVCEISESIWENLVDLSRKELEPLREHMDFLDNFHLFATRRGVDLGQMKDFLTHTVAVAISAAHLCFLCGDDIDDEGRKKNIDDEEWQKGLQFKISMLVQKIKPIDPHVCETYSQVISCSKYSRRLDAPSHIPEMVDDSTFVMEDFVDSLIYILWVMLQQDTCHVASLKDHRQVLYEGLRSLRTILKKLQPKDIDEKTRDDIGIMVCDAGVLFFSFYQKNGGIDLGLQDLWERINVFLAEDKEKVPQTSTINPSSINGPGFVDFLLQNLMELPNSSVDPIVQSRVQSIEKGLVCLKSFLEEIVELRYEEAELRAFQTRVLEVARRVEFLIDYLIVGDISDSFSMLFDSVMEDIQNIKTDAWKSSSGKRQDIKVKEVSSTSSHVLPPHTMAFSTTEIVGFHDEATSITDRLQRGSKHLKVIAIVGMGGRGKTTLAAKVYNDPAIVRYFHVRVGCPVSQAFDKRTLLLELLNQIHSGDYSKMTEDDLAAMLRQQLKGRRYLIFLDDVWTIEAWNSLQASFPDDSTGSRIILTSRNDDAVRSTKLDEEPLLLRKLSKEESLELLQRKLFSGEVWPPALYELGMQIAKKCKGLPLTIVLVAGLLATTEQKGWKEIVDGLSSGAVSINEQCMISMELSYQHLPDYLKPCFLYFGAFPEDQEVSVRKLIRLWIAEGFIRESSLVDAVEHYVNDLIRRSLIMIAKRGSIGGVKTCRIHDLLRDFCLRKGKDEHFLHLVKGYDGLLAFNEPSNLRRLCIHSEFKHLEESKLFCPRARSLFFFPSKKGNSIGEKNALKNIFLVHIFKFVRVLDLEEIDLGHVFPSEIELLVQLRYLAIKCRIEIIPSWIGNLSMLETFILIGRGQWVSLPDTIWNLQKLKYLYVRVDGGLESGCGLPSANPEDNSSVLYELDTLSGVVINCEPSIMEKQISKFPNIRKLRCVLKIKYPEDGIKYWRVQFDFLTRLEYLRILLSIGGCPLVKFEFSFPANLKKLTLSEFHGPWSKMISTIGGLPNLEVLKLDTFYIVAETWELKEGEFPKLRYLKLSWMDLERWTASDDEFEFPCLEKLVLERCQYLEEMPCCLESTQTLEMIEVRYCSKATATFVKHIKEEQESMGNSALNILLIE